MVGQQEDGVIRLTTLEGFFFINVSPSKQIEQIFTEVAKECGFAVHEIEIVFKADGKEIAFLSNLKNTTLGEAKLWPRAGVTEFEMVLAVKTKNQSVCTSDVSEDELILGASASPTAGEPGMPQEEYANASFDQKRRSMNVRVRPATRLSPIVVESSNYVGLVNQAMTCYLNSLLQALYMTPEFRNALYNWEFDGANETRSIPYQLQRLFLNLQTSSKSAVETTDLTTSFGWQGSDAWHQHDIQELCRVMFDALEQKFKDTKQANLINDLYEGKMQDYVKCLECGTEKCREDTFLDIPLPVRPFGSTVAYNSVEEALRAFVQPETLDGNNQYFCEKCNKKCDAHKGLKFSKFPYLLTLHLKRFDFDYSTMHRIKLNDKVVFSEKLNLNSFILNKCDQDLEVAKSDDCSTTDSGAADDESCQGTDLSAANGQDDNCADSDEGIDVSSGNLTENDAKGPFVYELFSIMIHSGSASGGHYYAYIKDFDKNLWFCFNDQNVSPITEEDIKKTYGGGSQRPYYSASYSSSNNAYMLMYRQIDKERNCRAMSVAEFPPHLQRLLASMRKKEEEDRINKKKEDDMVKLNVWCDHPKSGLHDLKISSFTDSTLAELAQHCYNRFKLDNITSIENCRMVFYNKQYKCINCSFDSDDIHIGEILWKHPYDDWMLELREPNTEWKHYQKGGINMKVYPIVMESDDVDEPKLVRVDVGETVGELKQELGAVLQTEPGHLKVALNHHEVKFFSADDEVVPFEAKGHEYRLYVTNTIDASPEMAKKNNEKFKKLIDQYSYVICLNVVLPDTDEGTLESMAIPALDQQDKGRGLSPQPVGMGDGYDQSNSEDSSLSDSDRTLIGDAPEYVSGNNSPAPDELHLTADPCNEETAGKMAHIMNWDSENMDVDKEPPNYYFRITSVTSTNVEDETNRQCKVLVDKRMTLETLKKHLESIIRVPSEYFKVFRHHHMEDEWSRLKDSLRSLSDGEKLTLKLGRVLKEGEQQCKVYYLNPESMDPSTLLMEHIISKNQTVEAAKKEILEVARVMKNLSIPYNRCRLREKSWKKPKKVYLDDQKFGEEIVLPYSFEMYLQELKEPETVTSNNQVVIFLRQFSPADLTLGPFQEVVLDLLTMDDLLRKVSDISDIPIENLDVANVKGSYPYDLHILEIQEELDWNPKQSNLDQWPLSVEDGSIDNRESPRELTLEEKRELRQKEDARLGRLSARTYSPCRERALKIYLDSSPSGDNAID